MAITDILSEVCYLYAKIGGSWVNLGTNSEQGTNLGCDPETTRINSSQKPQPADILGGKMYIELQAELLEVNMNTMMAAFPGITIATSAAGSGFKASIGEGYYPGASLRAAGYKYKMVPVDPSDDRGVFIALGVCISPIDFIGRPDDVLRLPLTIACFEDSTETAGQKVVCISDHASTDVTGWT